ncbi:MAG: hypothetical protein IKL62_01670 [Clostridia bacterium]|nr:hypothetical protein [Clostridia bacterium]
MKALKVKEHIISSVDGKDKIYTLENDVYVRDVIIDANIGDEVMIAHLPDVHFNYCNLADYDSGDEVVISTGEHRKWLSNGASVPKLRRCLEVSDDADQYVFNGDTLDYLSKGAMELMDKEIWDKIPGAIATIGGHERAKQMQGKVSEVDTIEDRYKILEGYWRHDIYYHSRLVKNKVLVVGYCNDRAYITPDALEKFKADIELCRKNGYVMVMFAHEPVATHNPDHKEFPIDWVMTEGDPSGSPWNFCDGFILGGTRGNETSREFYDILINSADVIKGVFAGHYHNDMEIPINGKLPDGTDVLIPQYLGTAVAYGKGHIMRILIK